MSYTFMGSKEFLLTSTMTSFFSQINLIFSEQSDYLGCIVFRLTSGSIIADIVTYFNTSTSLNETKISDVINDGFETQNQSAIVIVPERTVTQAGKTILVCCS